MTRTPLRVCLEEIARYDGDGPEPLARLVQVVRPTALEWRDRKVPRFDALVTLLENDPVLCAGMSAYLRRLTKDMTFHRTLTDAGLPSGEFWPELRRRIGFKLLPPQPEEHTSDHLLVNVFYQERDADWVSGLNEGRCIRFLHLLGLADDAEFERNAVQELLFAVQVLGLRVAGKAFDADVLRMLPEVEGFDNPFFVLADAVDDQIAALREDHRQRSTANVHHVRTTSLLADCRRAIAAAFANSARLGMTMRLNQQLMRMERMLDRLEVVLDILAIDHGREAVSKRVQLFKTLVVFSAGSTRVMGFLNASTHVVAREITQHTGRTGEHYITTTASEYRHMLRSALGGGALVALACVIKAWMGTLEGSLFGHALLYSLNYAWVFIGIYLLHLTLATKQPAMTAATIAATLDEGRGQAGDERYQALAGLIARVWRSQFIAFVGNVFMAFPVAVALAYGWNALFGPELFAHKSAKLIHELHPVRSLAVPHAAIAGIFLFISGLIAGSVSNWSVHGRIPQRLREHPVLKVWLGPDKRERLARFFERNAGGIISNFWFGVFMGSVGMVGTFFGLPLDIRHITFAAGNLGLGLVGANWSVDLWMVLWSVLGIGLIGFINFAVSFGLSLSLALRSRGIALVELAPIVTAVRLHFRKEPASFFFPPIVRRNRGGAADEDLTQ
jgi:site-specific recombinase